MLQAELRVAAGRQTGSVIALPIGKFLVGREEDCHLRPNSDLVSRHHCVFTSDEVGVRLRDLGSTNGTFVNGERIRGAVVLNHGDRVSIGKLDFEVVLRDPAMEQTAVNINDATQASLPTAATAETEPTLGSEAGNSETMIEMPVYPQSGDTAYMQPQMQPGMYGAPLGYPQFPQYGYSPYQMPGYYPQPMGYPPMGMYPTPMGMPGMPPQGMGMPGMQPQAPPEPAAADPGKPQPEVRLPDPTTTGAKAPPAPAPPKEGAAADAKKATIPETAANIIQQYRARRPT